jgi:hypothetical protein
MGRMISENRDDQQRCIQKLLEITMARTVMRHCIKSDNYERMHCFEGFLCEMTVAVPKMPAGFFTVYLVGRPMLHVVALSFVHDHGNKIDIAHPPFPDEPHIADWVRGLPYIALSDKTHNACALKIQFTLPHPGERNHCVYGLAAYRSIATSELRENDAYTQNYVQRSLCVISRVPLFGELETHLKNALSDNS